jgi:leucyl-tRNA synthetase
VGACSRVTRPSATSPGRRLSRPVTARPWPSLDEAAVREDDVAIAVQINGKVRGRIRISKTADQDAALEAARDVIAKDLAGNALEKIIYVPGRSLELSV